jgi:Ca-activated chloride channel homolog
MNACGAPGWLLRGAILLLAAVAAAQPAGNNEGFREETGVSAVLIPVTVRDARGRLVAHLDQRRFHLYVDGIEFPIQSFWQEGALPISLGFVLDTSGSMGTRRLHEASKAILEFAHQLGPNDEASLITFGAGKVKRRLPFGTDPGLLTRILESLHGYGTTALYDMLTAMPQVMEGAHHPRRAILLFTDGVDTASQWSRDDAIKVLENLNDPLYVFGIEPPPSPLHATQTYEDLMANFAAATGGRYLRVDEAAQLPQAARALRRELGMRYIISLDPSGIGSVKLRKVAVRVDGPFQVVTRQTYRGTLP